MKSYLFVVVCYYIRLLPEGSLSPKLRSVATLTQLNEYILLDDFSEKKSAYQQPRRHLRTPVAVVILARHDTFH